MPNPIEAAFQDTIGIAGVGTQSNHSNVYSTAWQFGIAIDLNNRKFDYGTVISLSLAADGFSESNVNTNETEFGVTAANKNINSLPSNYIQHGDRVMIGPSTYPDYEGYSEDLRVAAAAQDQLVDADNWTNGVIYSLDRRNKYKYQLSDPMTVVGMGMAAGWHARNSQLATLGIMKGYSSLGAMGRYAPNWSNNIPADITQWENSKGNNFIGLMITLPPQTLYNAAVASGPNSGPLGGFGPAVFNSTKALGPWRGANYAGNDNTWDWAGATTGSTMAYQGVFRYILKPSVLNFAFLAYDTNVNTPLAEHIAAKNSWAGVLTGFVHDGGQYKDYAQCLFTMVNSLSNSVDAAANYQSNGVFTQILTHSLDDAKDMRYSKLVAGTNYRLGITWKGDILPDNATNVGGSEVFAKFQWGPIASAVGDLNTYPYAMISTDALLDSTTRSQNSFVTNMVSGAVETVDTDDLDPYLNQKIEIILKAKSPQVYASVRQYRGAEINLLVDQIWLEHEGDIPGASGNGYVEIDHFPEQGTLTTNRYLATKPLMTRTSNGRSLTIDPTGTQERYMHHIEADFLRVTETIYNQFLYLLRWQDMGYRITLHPFLPNVPHCLIGILSLSNVSKSFWDMTRFSFRLTFIETD